MNGAQLHERAGSVGSEQLMDQVIAEAVRTDEERLRALHDLRTALASTADAHALFAGVRAIAGAVLPHDEVRLALYSGGVDSFRLFVAPEPDANSPETRFATDDEPPDAPVNAGLLATQMSNGDAASGVRGTVHIGTASAGTLTWLSRAPQTYRSCDVLFVQLIADQIGSTLARQQLAALAHDTAVEREREAALDTSEELLRALARVLDIRQVFPQVSEIANKVLPHDRLTMTFCDAQGNFVMQAASNDEGPTSFRATGGDTSTLTDGYFRIVDDLAHHTKHGVTFDPPDHQQRVLAAGYQSFMSICLSAREQRF